MNELEIFEAYMKKEHPFIDVKSEAYAAMRNLWQARVPEGYVVVPKEPNQKQIDAGVYAVDLVSNDSIQVVNVYKAMIESEQ